MAAQERIEAMKKAMRRILANSEVLADCKMYGRPASMVVTYWDGPGIQFRDERQRPLLPDLIRDEELAITLWNALTGNAPIDPEWFA